MNPDVYGATTLADIETELTSLAEGLGHSFDTLQSNAEAELVDRVQAAAGNTDFILIIPGAFTHTSVALRDALLGVSASRLSKFTSATFMPARNSAASRISRTWPPASLPGWARRVTAWQCRPRMRC